MRFLRRFLQSRVCYRYKSTGTPTAAIFNTTDSVRRSLRPFVKLIHPDLFAQEGDTVKSANLTFLQTLNEIADIVDSMVVSMYPKKELAIKTALKSVYKFEFYSRVSEGEETKLALNKVNVEIPEEFTSRSHVLAYTKARRGIEMLLNNLGEVFDAAGLVNPWVIEKQYNDNNEYGFAMRDEVLMDDNEIQAMIDARLNERAMQRVTSVASLFTMKMKSGILRDVEADVDRYITNGNIMMMSNVTVQQEIKALERFRSFILQFNHLISFSFESWVQYIFFFDSTIPRPRAHKKKHRMYIYLPLKFSFKELLTFLSELSIALDVRTTSRKYRKEETES